jgi:hypothetical protein
MFLLLDQLAVDAFCLFHELYFSSPEYAWFKKIISTSFKFHFCLWYHLTVSLEFVVSFALFCGTGDWNQGLCHLSNVPRLVFSLFFSNMVSQTLLELVSNFNPLSFPSSVAGIIGTGHHIRLSVFFLFTELP